MPAWLMSALRTGAQALVGLIVTYLASRGVDLPLEAQDWIVQVLLIGGGIAAYTAGVRWLETRQGDGVLAHAARALAHVLMLGTGAKQPVYVSPDAARLEETLAPYKRR